MTFSITLSGGAASGPWTDAHQAALTSAVERCVKRLIDAGIQVSDGSAIVQPVAQVAAPARKGGRFAKKAVA